MKNLKIIARFTLFFLLVLFWNESLFAQNPKFEGKKIEFLNADVMQYDNAVGNMMRLKGRVMMRHGDAVMYADSAYRYMDKDYFEAFGQIHIEKGDSVDLYGDSLIYDGTTGIATLKGRVRMIDNQVNMESNSLEYDVKNNKGFYRDSAVTRSSQGNILKSKNGTYYADSKEFVFTKNVTIESKDYTVFSDTLHFNTETEVAYFYGPTKIVSDSNIITCDLGWYDTKNDISSFSKGATITTPKQEIKADSLYYERKTGYGLGFNNVSLKDSTQNMEVRGNYSVMQQNINQYMVTDSVTLIMGLSNDSLYLSADSLFSVSDSLCGRIMRAYNRVRIYKHDFQGKCDSLVYYESDSLLQLYTAPVLWTDENQLTSIFMQITMRDKKIDVLDMIEDAFIISEEDTIKYNQISGVNMKAYFGGSSLRKVDVFKNGETIYYPRNDKESDSAPQSTAPLNNDSLDTGNIAISAEKNIEVDTLSNVNVGEGKVAGRGGAQPEILPKLVPAKNDTALANSDTTLTNVQNTEPKIIPGKEFIGVNRVKCEDIVIHLDSGKVDRIVFKGKPVGNLSPFENVNLSEYKLAGFKWMPELRPKSILDIYSPRIVQKYAYMPQKKTKANTKKPAKKK